MPSGRLLALRWLVPGFSPARWTLLPTADLGDAHWIPAGKLGDFDAKPCGVGREMGRVIFLSDFFWAARNNRNKIPVTGLHEPIGLNK